MSFDIHDGVKTNEGGNDIFFGQKTCVEEKMQEESPYQNNLVVPKDLFESITEGHYLPELVGHHDDTINANELLDSLVEKGCEDNQILGHAFDKLAHLVGHNSTEYNEDDDDMLLDNAPVTDIIDRLEQSLSPGQNSINAAQGLLHLQQMSEELAKEQLNVDKLTYDTESYESEPVVCDISKENLKIHLPLSPEKICEEIKDIRNDETLIPSEDNDVLSKVQSPDEALNQSKPAFINDQPEVLYNIGDTCITNASDIPRKDKPESEETLPDEQEGTERSELADNSEINNVLDSYEGKYNDSSSSGDDLAPTDLSFKLAPPTEQVIARPAETTEVTDNMSDKSDELPRDLSCHKRAVTPISSPKRIDIPRPPSRESDAMQSPQPSGIPAIPSSPELFTVPNAKSNKSLFLETLLASPSPKMCFSSELTITKHQSEPLNLGKNRKSASPTVSSCSDEIKKMQKEFGEPEEKRIKKETAEELAMARVAKLFSKSSDELSESKLKKIEKTVQKHSEELSPLKQLQILKLSNDFNVPDPLLVPKEKLNDIIMAPGREIPALLIQRPELRLPEAFAFPAILQDPDILVISLSQLENILENKLRKHDNEIPQKQKEQRITYSGKNTPTVESTKGVMSAEAPAKQIPSMEALAGDIDAATSAALNQMLWLPYLSQLEAAVACSQNADFLKALNTSGYPAHGAYPDLAQMFAPSSRFMGPAGFPMMPQIDYNNQLELAMWQEAMNQTNHAAQRSAKQNSAENQLKELAKAADAQNAYLHSPKGLQNRSHSAARTSPIAHNYNANCQRSSMNHANQFLPSMYSNLNANVRPNVPLPGLQIPHFNPNMMVAGQRSGRSHQQQKSPTSPYFHNNNYLQSLKQSSSSRVSQSPTQKRSSHASQDGCKDSRSNSTSSRPSSQSSTMQSPSEDGQKPRISVKSLHNLLEPSQATAHQNKRMEYMPYHSPSLSDLMAKPVLNHTPLESPTAASHSAMKMRRQMLDASLQRRMLGHDEGEVGSTTAHDEAAGMPLHADPQTHLWHPLFGNQKGYSSPWNWTTVTVNGE